MPVLKFEIESDLTKAINLRDEITKLEKQLNSFDGSTPETEMRKVEERLGTCRNEFTSLITVAAKAGAELEGDFKSKVRDANQGINELTGSIEEQKRLVGLLELDIKKLSDAYKDAVKQGKYAQPLKDKINSKKAELDGERRSLIELTAQRANDQLALKGLKEEYSHFKSVVKESSDINRDVADSAKKDVDVIGELTAKMKGWAATLIGGMGIKEFIGKVVSVRGEFENIEVSLRTLLGGSEEKMQSLMGQLKEYALISPLTTKDMASALQMMIGFGIDADQSVQYLKALGDVSMGNTQHFNSLALAFSQMSAAGKLMGQDLNQMINAGFNPLQTMSEKTGKSIGELKKEMSDGAITAEMVQQAFIDATSAGGKFYGMAEAGSKTIKGQLSMLEESFDNIFNDIGTKSEGMIISVISGATSVIENYETIGKVLAAVAATYGVYKAELVAVMAMEKIQAIQRTALLTGTSSLSVATGLLEKKTAALNATLMKNPYALVAVAVVALGTSIYSLYQETQKLSLSDINAKEAQQKMSDATAGLITNINDEKGKLDELRDKLSTCKKGTQEWETAKQSVISQFGQYYANLGDEIDRVGNLSTTYDQLAASARNAAKARAIADFGDSLSKDTAVKTQDALKKVSSAVKALNKDGAGLNEADAIETALQYINGELTYTNVGKRKLDYAQLFSKYYGNDVASSLMEARSAREENNAVLYQFKKNQNEDGDNILDEIVVKGNKPKTNPSKAAEKERKEAADAQAKAKKAIAEENERWAEQQEKNAQDRWNAVTQAEIDAMKDGKEKTIAQLTLDYTKELDQIGQKEDALLKAKQENAKKIWTESDPNNKNKIFEDTEEYKSITLTDEDKAGVEAQRTSALIKYRKEVQDVYKSEAESMRSYLKEYGTYQQQRLAIAEEYAEKIREAQESGSKGEELKAVADRDKALGELDFSHFQKLVNWDVVFADIDKVPQKALETLETQLTAMRSMMGKKGTLTPEETEQLKTITEALEKIKSANIENSTFPSLTKAAGNYIQSLKKLSSAQSQYDKAMSKSYDGTRTLKDAWDEAVKAQDGAAIAALENVEVTWEETDAAGNATQSVITLAEAFKKLQKAQTEATDGGSSFGQTVNKWGKSLSNIGQIGTNATQLAEQLGFNMDGAFGNGVGKALEGMGTYGEALESFDITNPGSFLNINNYINAAKGYIKMWEGIGQAVGSIFGLKGADYSDYNEMVEKYNDLISVWDTLIDRKKEYVDISYGDESRKAGQEALDLLEKEMDAYRTLGKERLNSGASAGSHSIGVRIRNGMSSEGWAELKDWAAENGVDYDSIASGRMTGLFDLTSEQIASLQECTVFWNKLDGDVQEYLQDIIDSGDAIEEMKESIKETLTDVSFDSFYDDWVDMVSDMDTTNADMAENMGEYLRKAIMGNLIATKYKERLQDLYDSWAEKSDSDGDGTYDLTSTEADEIKSAAKALGEEMLAERDALADIFDGSTDEQQSATGNAAESITQDQASEISGRITAVEYSGEQRNQLLTLTNDNIERVLAKQVEGNNIADGIRDILANSYLELQQINENTEAIVKPIKNISDKIDIINNKVKNL